MKTNFYDIESLDNVFTLANFRAEDNVTEMYYLLDTPELIAPSIDSFYRETAKIIRDKNKNFTGVIEFYDLADIKASEKFAKTFGLSTAIYANNPDKPSMFPSEYRLTCDTDPEYDEDLHPYLFGYNSYNYDTTMLALYLAEVFTIHPSTNEMIFSKTTAKTMRRYNDELFSPQFKERMYERLRYSYKEQSRPQSGYGPVNYRNIPAVIRKNMLMSGRHIDVAKLNEKQQHVGLKRILGMLGYQILESDKLKPGQNYIETTEQLMELFAYNVSDVVNLNELFHNSKYTSPFTLKRQLLKTYPDLVYDQKIDSYEPNISPKTVRNDRLVIDASSAQFSTKSLCPYGHLKDYDTVSFMYPSEKKSKELGIPRVNVLEETKNFFYKNFTQPELRAKFDNIYNYYKSIEGKNFNSSNNYLTDHDVDPDNFDAQSLLPDELKVYSISDIKEPESCMFYYNKDGTPSTCFVNFSIGGIHGAEYNKKLFDYDVAIYGEKLAEWKEKIVLFDKVKQIYPDPCDLKKNKGVEIDGVKYKPSTFLVPKSSITSATYKDYPKKPEMPTVFVSSAPKTEKDGETANEKVKWNIAKRYAFTSTDMTNHEDFTSYYPNLLRMMDAFFNKGLGYDRYGEIFDNKTKYGHLMKDKSLSQEERDLYSVLREGTKLILNSATGAADSNFESNIRMNNKIISMRIIGQLFTWRIGQAQTIEGAKITSTNTDGLYSVMESIRNNEVLAKESADIHVEIEPEPIYLISKDSNNRAEIEVKDNQLTEITSASGGTLGCRKGPTPTKSLSHPAIIDWALTEYLLLASINYKGISMEKPFDKEIGMSILKSARKIFNDDIHTVIMFQNVIASSPSTIRFAFATTDDDPDSPIPLQHYNRCFIVKDGTPGTYHMQIAAARVITPATVTKRKKANERMQQNNPIASSILSINNVDIKSLPMNKETAITKITGIEESWYMMIDNTNIHLKTQDELNQILDSLDYDKYLYIFADSYENNWRNMTPEWLIYEKEQKINAKKSKASNVFDVPTETPEQYADGTPTPHIIELNKTSLTDNDVLNGENCLIENGILDANAHAVLAQLLKVMTDTDI